MFQLLFPLCMAGSGEKVGDKKRKTKQISGYDTWNSETFFKHKALNKNFLRLFQGQGV